MTKKKKEKVERVLVTGATGQLGHAVVKELQDNYEVTGVGSEDFDIRDLGATRKFIKKLQPDVIVHAAAYTDVDGCEENREKAIVVNGLGTRNIAIAAREVHSKMFYISSDYVFSGEKEYPYVDYDDPDPRTVYGQSKLLGETYVVEQLNRFFILRIAWLYGNKGDNFLKTMLQNCKRGEELRVVDDQFGSPTRARDVARQILSLISTKYFGTYNSTAGGSASWFDFAVKIFQNSGYLTRRKEDSFEVFENKSTTKEEVTCRLTPVSSDEFPRPADRPKNSVLKNELLEIQGVNSIPKWEEGLKDFLQDYDSEVN